jgi:hypothetical protein
MLNAIFLEISIKNQNFKLLMHVGEKTPMWAGDF